MKDFHKDLRYREIPSKQQDKETYYYDHIWDFYPFTDMDIHILPTYPEYLYPNCFFEKKNGSKIPFLPTVWTYV